MSYIGRGTDKISNVEKLDNISFSGSTATFNLTKGGTAFIPSSAECIRLAIDGIEQGNNYTVSGSQITFDFTPSGSSTNNWIYHIGVGVITTPADGSVTTAKLGNNSVGITQLNVSDGSNGQALTTNGSGTLAFSTISGGVTGITTNMSSGTGITLNSDGSINKPLQPCFYATVTGESRTGMDTESTMKYATEVFDVGSDYNNSTYTFTAPVTGKYQFNITLGISGFTSSNDIYIRLQTSNRNMDSRVKSARSNADMLYLSVLTDMDASDTALVRFRNYEDGSQEFYSDRSQFSGFLAV